MENKISIIIPVFNSEKYLTKCIDSILGQTYSNIEVICINDGSTDSSESILQEYIKKDSRIILFSQINKGQLASREQGIKIATGNYIMFVDSDDWLNLEMIEKMVHIQKQYNADIVRCTYIDEHIEENRHVVNKPVFDKVKCIEKNEFEEKLYPIFLNTHQINSVWGQLIRKELIKPIEIDSNIRIAEDLMFNLNLYPNCNKIVFIPNAFYHYRSNLDSITNKKSINTVLAKAQNVITVYSKYYQNIKNWNINSKENKSVVTNRIFKEADKCINELYTFKTSHSEKLNVLKSIQMRLSNVIEEKENLKLEYKLLIDAKYNLLIIIKFFKFKILYSLKNIAKKILIIKNIKKGK